MNKRRKPLTQLLATVSKSFTSLESAIDVKSVTTIPYKLQQARNKYAAKKIPIGYLCHVGYSVCRIR